MNLNRNQGVILLCDVVWVGLVFSDGFATAIPAIGGRVSGWVTIRIVKVIQASGTGIIALGRHAYATLQRRLSKLWCALNCPGRLATANIYFSVPAFVVLFRESLEVHLHCYDLPSMRCCTKDGDCYSICRGHRLLICYCIRQGKESASTPKSLHCAQLWIVKGVAASEPALKHLSTAQHTSFPTRVCGV